ncbi:MAG: serine hydroxymethyltransferase [Desulfobacterales bacterium]|nr:serine hydroxymethyltransferase [Desulfobacterales bacterium]
MEYLARDDPELARIICAEENRIESTLDLIAAENHPPPSVLEVLGSVLTTKTIEGYPHRRFHAGCIQADAVETLAVERAQALFGAEHANVQPHSGTAANFAVYFSVLDPGDRVLAMSLPHGGHLSHGHAASISSRCFAFAHYPVDEKTERIDYDTVRELAERHRPKMIVAGASAYPRLIDYERMAQIAREMNAYLMVDMAHIAGLVAAGVIQSPVPFSDFVTFTCYKTMMGGRGGVVLSRKPLADRLDRAVFPGSQGTSPVNVMAAKALAFRLAGTKTFFRIQHQTVANAQRLAAGLSDAGYRIVTGGTDNHQVIVDVGEKGITGAEAEAALETAGIAANRNAIPSDAARPGSVSGVRLGTGAAASRGMGEKEMARIVALIHSALEGRNDPARLGRVASQVRGLCDEFPVYRGSEACLMAAFD